MNIVLVAHSMVERVMPPDSDSYDRYMPRLHKWAAGKIIEWADEVLFAYYEVFTKSVDEGFGKTHTQALGQGERVLRTQERPFAMAKNRLNLPEKLPLDWREYAKYINDNNTTDKQETE